MHYWAILGYKQDLAGLNIRIHSKIITWKDRFMSIISLLHNLLKEKLPSLHAIRLQALMAAVEAGLSGASVSEIVNVVVASTVKSHSGLCSE
jgi:hypothetical protein